MKRLFIVLCCTICITSILYFLVEVVLISNLEPKWEVIDDRAVGTITKISRGRGGGAWFSYISDGKLHEEFDGLSENGLTIGEKYWIKYCSTCSNILTGKIKAIAYEPIFAEHEDYIETTAIITRIYKFKWFSKGANSKIEYIYRAGNSNIEFERSQTLPPNYKEEYPNLRIGQEYRARVWNVNYQRAIIDLDKPIK